MRSTRLRKTPEAEHVELLLQGGKILDVFQGEFVRADLAIRDGRFVGYGSRHPNQVVNIQGAFLVPGFIDTHVHLESSQVLPAEFSRAVVPRGTTAVIADPHEIANVHGAEGVRYMLRASAGLPLNVFFTVPSCVPASSLGTSGAELFAADVSEMLGWPRVVGLGEMMNYPGVLAQDQEILAKLDAARGLPIDGHAPGLSGEQLWNYVLAGPRTDHECTSFAEAREKLASGMHIHIRQGTAARNLEALLPLLSWQTAPFVHFCTDDRHPHSLADEGHLDSLLRQALQSGVEPELALTACTLHAARCYGLFDLGALAPGFRADCVVLSDLKQLKIEQVYCGGTLSAAGGEYLAPPTDAPTAPPSGLRVDMDKLQLSIPRTSGRVRVIELVPGQVFTRQSREYPTASGAEVISDPQRDLLKLAVVERHRGTGRVGLGLVRGFGLNRGALASTVAHDTHNLVVVGARDEDMLAAVRTLVAHGGGQVVVDRGRPVALLPFPIAGLMSDRPLENVLEAARELGQAAAELGCPLPDPFMSLSFLALEVIPELKLSDRGLVDVEQFSIVPLFEHHPRGG